MGLPYLLVVESKRIVVWNCVITAIGGIKTTENHDLVVSTMYSFPLNPLHSNSDQRQISLCNINAFMRIKTNITRIPVIDEKILPASAISNVWQQEKRICSVMLEIEGLKMGFCSVFLWLSLCCQGEENDSIPPCDV